MAEPHEEREHKLFSPSQAERFFACAGSTNFLKTVPVRPSSPYAIEGTKAHTVLEAAFRAGVWSAEVAHREHSALFFEELNTNDNNFYFSVDVCLQYVKDLLDAHPDALFASECNVLVPCEAAPGQGDGFADVLIYIPSLRTVYSIDFKHGAGVAKDAENNRQLMQYGAGAVHGSVRYPGVDVYFPFVDPDQVDKVVLVIVQPRAFHKLGMIREWETTPYRLYEYLDELNDAVVAGMAHDAPLTPGEDQCRFCDARTLCPAREAQAVSVMSDTFSQIAHLNLAGVPAPADLPINRLAYIASAAPVLQKFLDDVNAHLYELAMAGVYIPGMKLVQAQARREWHEDIEATAARAADMSGLPPDAFKTVKLIPITTAEKIVVEALKKKAGQGRKKVAAEEARKAFAYLTTKASSGNLVLVREDDDRPAVNRSQAFQQIATAALLPPPSQT